MFQVSIHHKFKNGRAVCPGAEEKQWQPWHQCCCEQNVLLSDLTINSAIEKKSTFVGTNLEDQD